MGSVEGSVLLRLIKVCVHFMKFFTGMADEVLVTQVVVGAEAGSWSGVTLAMTQARESAPPILFTLSASASASTGLSVIVIKRARMHA